MLTWFNAVTSVGVLIGASLVPAVVDPVRDCGSGRHKPPVLTVRVLGNNAGRVSGGKLAVKAQKGVWSATATTDEAGEATFYPPKAGTYVIALTCDVPSCGDRRQLEHRVELHNGSSTSTLLTTESLVIY
jgi:hypothetical protein